MVIPYHEKLDIVSIVAIPNSKPEVTFVAVLPHEKTVSYLQVKVVRPGRIETPIHKLRVYGPTEDAPQYSGYVEFEEPVNPLTSPLEHKREQLDGELSLLFRFIAQDGKDALIQFQAIKCFVDVFNEDGMYFVTNRNKIKVQDNLFANDLSATSNARDD